jgi:hypothetical protein
MSDTRNSEAILMEIFQLTAATLSAVQKGEVSLEFCQYSTDVCDVNYHESEDLDIRRKFNINFAVLETVQEEAESKPTTYLPE